MGKGPIFEGTMAPPPSVPVRWHALALVLAVLVPLLLLFACQGEEPSASEQPLRPREGPIVLAPGQLVVSINLDDNRASQADAALLLEARGMRGTFYVNSGRVGMPATSPPRSSRPSSPRATRWPATPSPIPTSPRWTPTRSGVKSAMTGWP